MSHHHPLRAIALAVAFALVAGVAVAADGKLSAADWKKVQADAEAAVAEKDAAKLRASVQKLAEDESVRALRFLEKVMAAWPHDLTPCALAVKQMVRDAAVQKEVRKEVVITSKPARVRAALAAALRADDDEDLLVLQKLLADAAEDVACTAARLLPAAGDVAVEPLIAQMEKLDKDRGPVWEEIRHGLTALCGLRLESAIEYRARWMDLKEKGGTRAAKEGTQTGPKGGPPRTVDLFGREIACSRVVFILDISGSMKAVDDPKLELPPDGGTRGKEPPKEGAPDPRSRIERAKRELRKVLKALPKTTKLNLVIYSSRVKLWRPGTPPTLHALDDATREDAVKFVDALTCHGETATDDGLAGAFDVEGARCFYLLSDGVPSKGRERIPTATILKLIEERNAVKKVRIHTLGFVGADQGFMKAVAKMGGGDYSDIK